MAAEDKEHSYSTRSPHLHIGHGAQGRGGDRGGLEQGGSQCYKLHQAASF